MAINLLILDDEEEGQAQLLEMLNTDVLELNIVPECVGAYRDALCKERDRKVSIVQTEISISICILLLIE